LTIMSKYEKRDADDDAMTTVLETLLH
jgi:hypothetical protein